jgi:hydrogenase maturation protease
MRSGPIWIVGYGNPLRGDDGVGQEVATALLQQKNSVGGLASATITCAHQLLPEMALDISRSRFAVFIDAAHDGRPGGSVSLQLLAEPPEPGPGQPPAASCWEDFTPANLLALSRCLFGTAPVGAVVTVGVIALGVGTGLSPHVRAAIPRAAAAVRLAITAVPERPNAVLTSSISRRRGYMAAPHTRGAARA